MSDIDPTSPCEDAVKSKDVEIAGIMETVCDSDIKLRAQYRFWKLMRIFRLTDTAKTQIMPNGHCHRKAERSVKINRSPRLKLTRHAKRF